MIEILKELVVLVKELPDIAVYLLVGILFYKVFIIGGVLSLIKFAITKLHDFLIKPKEVIKKYDLNGRFITHDGTLGLFNQLLDELQSSDYIHKKDVQFLLAAVREKKKRDADENTK